jgi:hypothetical protein
MKRPRFLRVEPQRLKESVLFGGVYLFLALINLRVKLFITAAWFDGTLEKNHHLLLAFQFTNNEQSRLLQFYIPEAFRRLLGLNVPHAYIVQWGLFVFLTLLCFHFYLRKWFDSKLAFAGVLFLAAIMPLTYRNHLQQSAPLLLLTFLLALWAIRDHHIVWYTVILAVGALNNETMLVLAAVFLFYNLKRLEGRHLITLSAETIGTTLPAVLLVGMVRYLTRDRPHLGGAWHLPENVQGLWTDLSTMSPFSYWQAYYLFIVFVFGAFWLYAVLKYAKKPLFLQRAALMIPAFVLAHFVTGITTEVRQMLPLSFIIIPMALYYMFPPGDQDPGSAQVLQSPVADQDVPEVEARRASGPGFAPVLVIGVIAALVLIVAARVLFPYPERQLASEPFRATIELLQEQPMSEVGLVCREVDVCTRISGYTPKLETYWLPSPDGEQAELLGEFAAEHPLLWFVDRAQDGEGQDLSVERWLGGRYGKVSQEWIDGARVARFVTSELPEPEHSEVLFGDQILLSGYAFNAEGRYLNLLLVWENAERVDAAIKPFIHVLDSNGEIVAQNDLAPVGDFSPASDWPPGSVVRDLHGLVLPADASGEYQARIGWYDPDTGERLRIEYPSALQGGEFLEIRLGSLAGE